MADMLPYGANIVLNSIASTLSENYPLNRSDYITSSIIVSEIQYSYENYNGDLVEIITNLELKEWDKRNHTFTVSNENIIGQPIKPYIKLCCNNVKIPISFIDHDGTGNKWLTSSVNERQNTIILQGQESVDKPLPEDYVRIASYYKISWNKSEKQQIFKTRDVTSSDYYACDVFYNYLDNDNNIQQGNLNIWSMGNRSFDNEGYITVPRLDGTSDSIKLGENSDVTKLTKKFINYFAIGVQVKINSGYSAYRTNTLNYIKGSNFIYDNIGRGFEPIKGKYYLKNNRGIPVQSKDLNIKWNSDFFYTTLTTSNNSSIYYISPSTSIIYYEQDLAGRCNSVCSCYGKCSSYGICSSYGGCNEDSCDNYSGGGPSGDYLPAKMYDVCVFTGQAYNSGWEHPGGRTIYVPAGYYTLVIETSEGWRIYEYNGTYFN